ncbi:hypothetical protein O9929_25795 [Vibrio lentus]|nr:hypothetical protein [Vibrio lentus]
MSNKLGSMLRQTALTVSFPPLGFCFVLPTRLYSRSSHAAIALAVLATLLPTVMVYKARYTDFAVNGQTSRDLPSIRRKQRCF